MKEGSRAESILFSEEFLAKLEQLALIAKRIRRGQSHGFQRTYRKGSSLEFHDHRSYSPGDDLRTIDWSVWARLGRLMVKLFTAEEDRTVYLLIDTSASMKTGNPEKLGFAVQAAAALAYIAGTGQDRVGVASFGDSLREMRKPQKGVSEILPLFRFLAGLEGSGTTDFNRSLSQFSRSTRRAGIAVVFSDLLDPGGYTQWLLSLLYARFEIILLHITSDEELSPSLRGPVRLEDRETGERMLLTVDREIAAQYRAALTGHFSGIETFALSRGIEYVRVSSEIPFEDLILRYLRQGRHFGKR